MELQARIKKLLGREAPVELTDPIEQGFIKAYGAPGWSPVGRYIDAVVAAGRIGELIDAMWESGFLGELIAWARESGRLGYLIAAATPARQAKICDVAGIEK